MDERAYRAIHEEAQTELAAVRALLAEEQATRAAHVEAQLVTWRERVAGLEAERDALRAEVERLRVRDSGGSRWCEACVATTAEVERLREGLRAFLAFHDDTGAFQSGDEIVFSWPDLKEHLDKVRALLTTTAGEAAQGGKVVSLTEERAFKEARGILDAATVDRCISALETAALGAETAATSHVYGRAVAILRGVRALAALPSPAPPPAPASDATIERIHEMDDIEELRSLASGYLLRLRALRQTLSDVVGDIPATSPPPALVEAVRRIEPWLRGMAKTVAGDDEPTWGWKPGKGATPTFGELRAILAALDGAPASTTTQAMVEAVRRSLRAIVDAAHEATTAHTMPDRYVEIRGLAEDALAALDSAGGGE